MRKVRGPPRAPAKTSLHRFEEVGAQIDHAILMRLGLDRAGSDTALLILGRKKYEGMLANFFVDYAKTDGNQSRVCEQMNTGFREFLKEMERIVREPAMQQLFERVQETRKEHKAAGEFWMGNREFFNAHDTYSRQRYATRTAGETISQKERDAIEYALQPHIQTLLEPRHREELEAMRFYYRVGALYELEGFKDPAIIAELREFMDTFMAHVRDMHSQREWDAIDAFKVLSYGLTRSNAEIITRDTAGKRMYRANELAFATLGCPYIIVHDGPTLMRLHELAKKAQTPMTRNMLAKNAHWSDSVDGFSQTDTIVEGLQRHGANPAFRKLLDGLYTKHAVHTINYLEGAPATLALYESILQSGVHTNPLVIIRYIMSVAQNDYEGRPFHEQFDAALNLFDPKERGYVLELAQTIYLSGRLKDIIRLLFKGDREIEGKILEALAKGDPEEVVRIIDDDARMTQDIRTRTIKERVAFDYPGLAQTNDAALERTYDRFARFGLMGKQRHILGKDPLATMRMYDLLNDATCKLAGESSLIYPLLQRAAQGNGHAELCARINECGSDEINIARVIEEHLDDQLRLKAEKQRIILCCGEKIAESLVEGLGRATGKEIVYVEGTRLSRKMAGRAWRRGDFVLIQTEFIGHSATASLILECRANGIPYTFVSQTNPEQIARKLGLSQ